LRVDSDTATGGRIDRIDPAVGAGNAQQGSTLGGSASMRRGDASDLSMPMARRLLITATEQRMSAVALQQVRADPEDLFSQ
jgi:hypothetical protein